MKQLSRREFLRVSGLVAASTVAAACAQPAAPEPTTAPAEPTSLPSGPTAEPAATEEQPSVPATKYNEAPDLAEMVAAGQLPPVDDRLPENPFVMEPFEMIGRYGGTVRRGHKGVADRRGIQKLMAQRGCEFFQRPGESVVQKPMFWESYDLSEDGTSYTIHLRKGARWSDGELIDTSCVTFWWDSVFNNDAIGGTGSWRNLDIDGVLPTVEILDQYTFTMSWEKPKPLMPLQIQYSSAWGSPTFTWPGHYLKQFHPDFASTEDIQKEIDKRGVETWDQLWGRWLEGPSTFWWLNTEVPMAGAWHVTVPPPSDHVIMERNPYYWVVDPEGNQLPYLDSIATSNFDSPEVLDMRIVNGEIDVQSRHVNMGSYTLYKENQEKAGYVVEQGFLASTTAFNLNICLEDAVLNPLLNSVDFRHALSIAINRDEINEFVYSGLQKPRQACPVTGSPEYDPEYATKWTEYDPDTANQILDSLGLTQRDGDGYRLNPDGEAIAIPIEYTTITGAPFGPEVELVVKDWADVGIKALNKEMERSLWEERHNSNQIAIPVYTCDKSFLVKTNADRYIGDMWATQYKDYYYSKGAEGMAPPEGHPLWDIWEAWSGVQVEPNEEKRNRLMLEGVIGVCRDNIWAIGTVGEGPQLIIRNNKIRNLVSGLVEENATASIYITKPEQWFYEE